MTNNPNLSPQQKWQAGRLRARMKARYLSALMMKMVIRSVPGLGTVGITEHGFILVDYDWIATKSVDECAGLWVHEVLHIFLRSADRRHNRERWRWNCASDRAINPMVRKLGLSLPPPGVWPSDLGLEDGLLADVYYEADKQDAAPMLSPQGTQGGPSGEGDGQHQDDQQDSATAEPGASNDAWGARCGSGAGGEPLPGEPEAGDPAARSAGELQRACKAVAEAIQQAAKSRGSVPAGLLLAAEEALKVPKVPWDVKLRYTARRAVAYKMGAFDYRYDAPSRRQAGVGFGWGKPVLPRMRCPSPQVAVVVDTSGSMGTDELHRAVSEVAGVMRSVGAPVTFLCCDAAVHGVQRVQDPRKIVLKGGGGTSFAPAFEAVEKERPKPSVVVFVTDGCGDAPAESPKGIHTIWVLVGPHRQRPHGGQWGGDSITWGEFIEVDEGTECRRRMMRWG